MLKYQGQKFQSLHLALALAGILFLGFSCEKPGNLVSGDSSFKLTSPEIGADSLLPIDYTCDGESATLPLEWSNFPKSTRCFALIMHHVASPEDIHWYWVVYNIPSAVISFERNVSGIGTYGNNSVNGRTGYAPPCSQGPGPKHYTYTIYALSDSVHLSVPSSGVNRQVLLNAIKPIVLDSAWMTVIYSRNI
jgi:phosphatidylethanolamine-binding protein (PEBP) family uncharacterized protein